MNMLERCWGLDSRVAFLNHGSFGACPLAVLAVQTELRRRMEAEPVRFLDRELEGLLDEARAALARFVGADPDDLAFVPNATAGVNTVLRSLRFESSDEILATDMEYNACRNAADFVVGPARMVVARIPFPASSPEAIAGAVMDCVTDKTRLALLSHITSPTGIILPVESLVKELQGKGIDVLVDGAHAPGQVSLDIAGLGAAYYTGNCHKWLCAPKGAAFLHVRRDRQQRIRPLIISHGANSRRIDRFRFRLEFDWTGTADPTPYLCVPAAIRFMEGVVPGGWPDVMRRNHALVVEARGILADGLGVPEPCPEDMLGSMAALPLPQALAGPPAPVSGRDPLQERLFLEYGIEVPVFALPGSGPKLLRISAQLYNSCAQYQNLAATLKQLAAA